MIHKVTILPCLMQHVSLLKARVNIHDERQASCMLHVACVARLEAILFVLACPATPFFPSPFHYPSLSPLVGPPQSSLSPMPPHLSSHIPPSPPFFTPHFPARFSSGQHSSKSLCRPCSPLSIKRGTEQNKKKENGREL